MVDRRQLIVSRALSLLAARSMTSGGRVLAHAKAGQTAAGEYTFNTPGVFDFFCSIPGHEDAGMKGTLTVVDPQALGAAAQPTHDVAGMPGLAMGGSASAPDSKPLPATLAPLASPTVAPPTHQNGACLR